VTLFCGDELPNRFRAPCFLTSLSARWHRVAIQQTAGIAQAWRTNRGNAYEAYLGALAEYQEHKEHEADGSLEAGTEGAEEGDKEPQWRAWNVPTLRQLSIQANSNVVKLEEAESGTPEHMAWNASKRGVAATRVKSAYSSQECHVCHYVDRKNRPNQQTFCCRACDHTAHADTNASQNIASRLGDQELRACQNRQEVKALLLRRHERWKQSFSLVVV
jgi:Transposase and inactivated derivatives